MKPHITFSFILVSILRIPTFIFKGIEEGKVKLGMDLGKGDMQKVWRKIKTTIQGTLTSKKVPWNSLNSLLRKHIWIAL